MLIAQVIANAASIRSTDHSGPFICMLCSYIMVIEYMEFENNSKLA